MWIVVTAIINDKKTNKMRMNFDNVVSYGPAVSAPCMVLCSDGQMYPITETPEQVDAMLHALTGNLLAKFTPIKRKK